jgi:hypothetical protein
MSIRSGLDAPTTLSLLGNNVGVARGRKTAQMAAEPLADRALRIAQSLKRLPLPHQRGLLRDVIAPASRRRRDHGWVAKASEYCARRSMARDFAR